jgi:hypothetical protein
VKDRAWNGLRRCLEKRGELDLAEEGKGGAPFIQANGRRVYELDGFGVEANGKILTGSTNCKWIDIIYYVHVNGKRVILCLHLFMFKNLLLELLLKWYNEMHLLWFDFNWLLNVHNIYYT